MQAPVLGLPSPALPLCSKQPNEREETATLLPEPGTVIKTSVAGKHAAFVSRPQLDIIALATHILLLLSFSVNLAQGLD